MKELVALAVIVLLCSICGWAALENWRGPVGTVSRDLYVPAAMFAAGQGFINPPVDEVLGMRAFIDMTTDAWEPTSFPERYSRTALESTQHRHRYLIGAMAIVWRVFGVSWDNGKLLAIALYAASGFAAYALMRVWIGWKLALVATLFFLMSPQVLLNLSDIRDFSKTPFILGTIALLCFAAKYPMRRRYWILCAALLGALMGLGLGFRRDLLIVPPAVITALVFMPRPPGAVWRERVAGIAVYGFVSLLLSAPILFAFQEHGALVGHDILVGTTAEHDATMGIQPANYARLLIKDDFYVAKASIAHSARELGTRIPTNRGIYAWPEAFTDFLDALVLTYPGDFLARGLQSTLRTLQGVSDYRFDGANRYDWAEGLHQRFNRWLDTFGLLHAAVAYLLISAVHLRASLIFFGLFVYFTGVISLQYELRHAFHMYAVTILCCVLPLPILWRVVRARFQTAAPDEEPDLPRAQQRRNVAIFLLLTSGAILVPLYAARAVQHFQVQQIAENYEAAEHHPVAVEIVEAGPFTVWSPTDLLGDSTLHMENDDGYVASVTYVLDLARYEPDTPICLFYENVGHISKYNLQLDLPTFTHGKAVQVCIPVYHHVTTFDAATMDAVSWARFRGVGVYTADADAVRGLTRIATEDVADTAPYCILQGDPSTWHTAQRLRFTRSPGDYWIRVYPAEADLHAAMLAAQDAAQGGDFDMAHALIADAPGQELLPIQHLITRARVARLEAGRAGELPILVEGLQRFPQEWILAFSIAATLRGTPETDLVSAWQQVAEQAPASPLPWIYLAREGLRKGDEAGTLAARNRVAEHSDLNPYTASRLRALDDLLNTDHAPPAQ